MIEKRPVNRLRDSRSWIFCSGPRPSTTSFRSFLIFEHTAAEYFVWLCSDERALFICKHLFMIFRIWYRCKCRLFTRIHAFTLNHRTHGHVYTHINPQTHTNIYKYIYAEKLINERKESVCVREREIKKLYTSTAIRFKGVLNGREASIYPIEEESTLYVLYFWCNVRLRLRILYQQLLAIYISSGVFRVKNWRKLHWTGNSAVFTF